MRSGGPDVEGLCRAVDRSVPAASSHKGVVRIIAPRRPRSDLLFVMVVVDGQRRVVQVARERRPAVEAVVDRLGRGGAVRDLAALREEPVVQRLGDGRCACSSLVQPLLRTEQLHLALDPVQLADELDGRRRDGALVGLVQLDELAPRMGLMQSAG